GVAKSIPQLDGETVTQDQTVTKVVSGTLQYMAPEILLERAPDTRADIFSFGIVLYELWSGTHPFRSSSTIETANRIMNSQPSSLVSVVPGTPAALAQVISRCLNKNPADRYPDALTLLSDLNKIELARAHSGQ